MSNTIPKYLQTAYNRLPAEQHHIALSVHDKGVWMAANVITGGTLRVRRDKNRVQTGKILAARVARLRITHSSIRVVFEVDLECGFAKVFKQVYVNKIPTR